MKIAINTRLLLKNKLEGIGWFTYEHFSRIVRNHPEDEFYFLFDRHFDKSFVFAQNVIPIVVPPPTRHPILQYIWFEKQLPRILDKIQPDLFISPDNYNSLKSKHKNLVVIHDLNFEHFPNFLPFKDRWFLRHFVHRYTKKADRIVTVSEYSKKDIVKLYGIEPSKIDRIYNGANTLFTPISEEEQISTRKKLTKGCPYFVYVGAFNPRKNIGRLLEAFEEYKLDTHSDTKLVLVGGTMYRSKRTEFLLKTMNHLDDVIFTGRKEPKELRLIVGSALALTYIPLFEGFGIPVVEAFKAGIPVITSNTTSLPEVSKKAAILVDPTDTTAIANAMKKITFDKNLRKELIDKGLERGKDFSWDKAAVEFWESIEKTIKG